jgi:hypothetical protein
MGRQTQMQRPCIHQRGHLKGAQGRISGIAQGKGGVNRAAHKHLLKHKNTLRLSHKEGKKSKGMWGYQEQLDNGDIKEKSTQTKPPLCPHTLGI